MFAGKTREAEATMSAVEGDAGSSKLTFAAKGAYLIWRAPVRPVPLDSQLKVNGVFSSCYCFPFSVFLNDFRDFRRDQRMYGHILRVFFKIGAPVVDGFFSVVIFAIFCFAVCFFFLHLMRSAVYVLLFDLLRFGFFKIQAPGV